MTKAILQTMGRRVRVLREEAGLNQIEMAAEVRRRGIECSNSTISNIESGRTNPSIEVFIAIADVLDVSADYLLMRSDVAEAATTPDATPAGPVMWHPETDEIAAIVDKWGEFTRAMFLDVARTMDDHMQRHHTPDVETVEGAEAFADRILSKDSAGTAAIEQAKSAKRN